MNQIEEIEVEVLDENEVEALEDIDNVDQDEDYIPISGHQNSRQRKKQIAFDMQQIELAKLVKTYPCLWNKQDAFFRNQVKRAAAWTNVAKTMEIW